MCGCSDSVAPVSYRYGTIAMLFTSPSPHAWRLFAAPAHGTLCAPQHLCLSGAVACYSCPALLATRALARPAPPRCMLCPRCLTRPHRALARLASASAVYCVCACVRMCVCVCPAIDDSLGFKFKLKRRQRGEHGQWLHNVQTEPWHLARCNQHDNSRLQFRWWFAARVRRLGTGIGVFWRQLATRAACAARLT